MYRSESIHSIAGRQQDGQEYSPCLTGYPGCRSRNRSVVGRRRRRTAAVHPFERNVKNQGRGNEFSALRL